MYHMYHLLHIIGEICIYNALNTGDHYFAQKSIIFFIGKDTYIKKRDTKVATGKVQRRL